MSQELFFRLSISISLIFVSIFSLWKFYYMQIEPWRSITHFSYTVVALHLWFGFFWFLSPEVDDPPDILSEDHSSLTLHHNTYITHLLSFHHVGVLPSHIIKRRMCIVQNILRERPHLYNLITVYFYNFSILLLAVVSLNVSSI